jgi:peptidyl-prolyl cis-trans isomerase C
MNLHRAFRSTLLASAFVLVGAAAVSAEDATTAPPAAPPAPPSAEGAVPTDRVVAIVDGQKITEMDLAAAEPDLQQALAQFPPGQQMAALIKGVIDIRLMARAAEAAAMDKDAQMQATLAYVHDKALRNAYLQDKLQTAVSDAALKARYDAEVAKFVPQDEIHAEHILVNTEEEAKAIIAQLDQGGDFAAIAKEKSTDKGSGQAGGDLGFFGKGQMVKPFEDAAFALDVGQYTKTPVKSDFGFHVIKVLEKRKSAPPTFEQRKDDLARQIGREAILAEIDALHAKAKIEMVPPPDAPADAAPATPPADATTPPATPEPGTPANPAPAQ